MGRKTLMWTDAQSWCGEWVWDGAFHIAVCVWQQRAEEFDGQGSTTLGWLRARRVEQWTQSAMHLTIHSWLTGWNGCNHRWLTWDNLVHIGASKTMQVQFRKWKVFTLSRSPRAPQRVLRSIYILISNSICLSQAKGKTAVIFEAGWRLFKSRLVSDRNRNMHIGLCVQSLQSSMLFINFSGKMVEWYICTCIQDATHVIRV